MTVDEIFNKLISRMVEGVMYHNEFAKAYDFLGLYGYSYCHFLHYLEENKNYQQLSHYYSTHYYKLITKENITQPEIIPNNWYKYTTIVVDVGTKRNAIKDLMNHWITWERSTKKLYEDMQQELENLHEVSAALYINNFILDVTKELRQAEKHLIELESINYDMTKIIEWQEKMEKKYKKKLGW